MTRALSRDATVYVAGHGGLVGSAIGRRRRRPASPTSSGVRSAQLDLREATGGFFGRAAADVVVVAAARVGGIAANSTRAGRVPHDNLRIQVNLLDAAPACGVERLLFLGSSCVYPKLAPQPIREDALLTGPLEPTNDAYAIAKIAGMIAGPRLRRQHGGTGSARCPRTSTAPATPSTRSPRTYLPALLRRFHAAAAPADEVVVWGTGTPRREFLHVDDLAARLPAHAGALRRAGPDQRRHRSGRDDRGTRRSVGEVLASAARSPSTRPSRTARRASCWTSPG